MLHKIFLLVLIIPLNRDIDWVTYMYMYTYRYMYTGGPVRFIKKIYKYMLVV